MNFDSFASVEKRFSIFIKKMGITSLLLLLGVVASVLSLPPPRIVGNRDNDFELVSREQWGASASNGHSILRTPVPYVVIHHTYIPRACQNKIECIAAMRSIQNTHQQTNGWSDIGYNFAIGSDGVAYEGRGWEYVGAHAYGFNSNSIGIVLIGDWVSAVPPAVQLETTKKLIAKGVELGYISPEYKLVGHRQVTATECPGGALFNEISTWDGFTTQL